MTTIPLNDTVALNEIKIQQWMPPAKTRGTADILWTCIVTIILCIWTAVHMNVPAPEDTTIKRVLRKAKWTVCGLLAPEILLYAAWNQFSRALALTRILNKERERHLREGTLKHPIPETFDLRYSFFVVMGGFRVSLGKEFTKSGSVVLPPETLEWLAHHGTFLWIDSRSIEARSKADNLTKLVICAQVTWLSVECIARKISGLPLTLLEIHTLGHVVCSLCLYLLWFKVWHSQTPSTLSIS